jgi:hypothetical protein
LSLVGGQNHLPNTSPLATATNVYAGWAAPSELLTGRSYCVNTEILQHQNDASFDNVVSPGCFFGTQDLFNVSEFGIQEQMMPLSNDAGDIDGMTVCHGHPTQNAENEFDFSGLPAQSISVDCAADSVNPIQWPLGDQFHGKNNPASDFIGNLNPQSLLDSEIPIPCHQFGCFATFKRDPDRIRHEAAVHGINKATYLCHVVGCNKSQGVGYTRKDKLTEHLWKKHGNLGYVKRT